MDIFKRQNTLARLLAKQGDLAAAHALYGANQEYLPTSGAKPSVAEYLEGWGLVLAALSALLGAARLWGAAEVLRAFQAAGLSMELARPDVPPCSEIVFYLGSTHPVYEVLGEDIARTNEPPYAGMSGCRICRPFSGTSPLRSNNGWQYPQLRGTRGN